MRATKSIKNGMHPSVSCFNCCHQFRNEHGHFVVSIPRCLFRCLKPPNTSTRSISCQSSISFLPIGSTSRINGVPTSPAPVAIQLRYKRLTILIGTFVGIVLALLIPIADKGVVLDSFKLSDMSTQEQIDRRDNYNSLISSVVSALNIPKDWFIGSILPVCFLAIASSTHIQPNPSLLTGVAFLGIDMSIRYLVNNGFQATHVVLVPRKMQMGITREDLEVDTTALTIMLNVSTNVSNVIPEILVDSPDNVYDYNYMTSTVLRNVLAPISLKTTAPECSPSNRNEDSYDSSQFATGLVQSYGFPARAWQSTMLPTNEFLLLFSFQVPMSGNITDIENATDWISVDKATNVFIHAMHLSQYFFRWLDPNSMPFNITGLIKQSKQPDFASSGDELPFKSVRAAELLNFVAPNSSNESNNDLQVFFGAARNLYRNSLSSGVNISQDEATMTFGHGEIFSGDFTFNAVTFEVPLRRNFFYRKLVMDRHNDALTEDINATALYTNISNAANLSDIYYDLDMSADCGPNPEACVMPRVQTYDFLGNKYQPDPQIKATAVCVNGNDTEEFEIEYKYYTVDGNESNTKLDVTWACKQKSNTSMYIISFGSRIEGDAMYDGRAPDSTTTPLDAKRMTIKNPRKIYSMTVVRLEWKFVNLSSVIGASCLVTNETCSGLVYILDVPVGESFIKNEQEMKMKEQIITVGEDSTPVQNLSPFSYDDTERSGTYTGFGTATRWISLMTLATPAEDAVYSQKGDILLWYNFKRFNRSSESAVDMIAPTLLRII